ncbi:STAS domain-containing protein [Amycolatopsis sp. NPDC024027]|uniref:STAS domain-containing protein n=1 Tax=Amycolatopsis sp. NPDC024027 TaxID=3154327 RepID=UPI0033DB76AE
MLDAARTPSLREPASGLPRPLTIMVTARHEHTTVAIAGEVDLAVTARVQDRLHDELRLRPEALIIDLTHVTFCSSSGLSALIEAVHDAHARGLPCAVIAGQRAVLRPIQVLHLDRVLPIHANRAGAEAWLSLVARLR